MTLSLSELAEVVGAEPFNLESQFLHERPKLGASQRRFDPLSYWMSTGAFEFGIDVRGCLNLLYGQDADTGELYDESFKRVTDFLLDLSSSDRTVNALANHKEFTDVIARTMSQLWTSPVGNEPYTVRVVKRQMSYALALEELRSKLTPAHLKLQDSLNSALRFTAEDDSGYWMHWVLSEHSYLADKRDTAFYHPSERAFAAFDIAMQNYRTSAEPREQMLERGYSMDDYRAYYERIRCSLDPIQVELLIHPLAESV